MKQLAVLSASGGSGRTAIVAALGHLASQEGDVILVDANIESAHLVQMVAAEETVEEGEFPHDEKAVIDRGQCTDCGECVTACRYGAIQRLNGAHRVSAVACPGCGACICLCPTDAITLETTAVGRWYRSRTPYGPLFHGELEPGARYTPSLVTVVRQQACRWTLEQQTDYLLIDGPKGVGLSAMAACAGSALALIIALPTVSGIDGLARMLHLTECCRVPATVLINQADLDSDQADRLVDFCALRDVPVIGRIPFDRHVIDAIVQQRPPTALEESSAGQMLHRIWPTVAEMIAAPAETNSA